MATTLASGPQGAKATLFDTIRNTLTAAKDDAALKAPVRRSSQQALTWLDNADFEAAPGTTAGDQAVRTVHNLRSVLSSVAGVMRIPTAMPWRLRLVPRHVVWRSVSVLKYQHQVMRRWKRRSLRLLVWPVALASAARELLDYR